MSNHQVKQTTTPDADQGRGTNGTNATFDLGLPHGPNTDGIDLPYHTNVDGYVVPDITYKDPKNRRIRVVTIGAGFSGILLAYRIQNELENVDHVVYEKNGEIGGAWLENRYPNCACDVPSHSYVYPFAPNPEWPDFYSKSEAIWSYLDRVCRVFDLRKYMKFNHRVSQAVWNEDAGLWKLKVEKVYKDGTVEEFDDECDVLLQAAGLLNNPILPKIEGYNSFNGQVIHTAQWPSEFNEEKWKNRKVVVVGAGASAVQTVPGMQPHVKELHVFVRSKTWLASAGPEMPTESWSPEQRKEFREIPEKLVAEARLHEGPVNLMWASMFKDSSLQSEAVKEASRRMHDYLDREDLEQGLIPEFPYGCRRVSPGINFMKAVRQPNVSCHFTPATRITPDSVIGEDGTEVKCDTIIFATGFDTTFRPHYRLVGQDGVSLADKWKDAPEGYLGVGCPGFPNFLFLFGPAWPVFAGSVTASLTAVSTLALKMIRKIQTDNIESMAPRQDVTDAFNIHQQTMLHGTVWEDNCSSWYKDKNGRITAIWPGSGLHFQEVVSEPRWEDYHIKYKSKQNMWEFLGRGFTQRERDPRSDPVPYFNVKAIDPKWLDSSISWQPEIVYNKESARLATAEDPSQHTKEQHATKIASLDTTGPDGSRTEIFAGAALVSVDEIGQQVKSRN
ncbi:monooxygenase [Ilyonectria sp. MPI-CAGE-AT-0026]|nr:monooxygenase [Ilyonectria sp. MPI-CAGE-AT-0026]